MEPVDDDLLRAVGREYQRLRRHRWELDPALRLPSSAYRILWRLDTDGASTLAQLTDALGLERSTVNRQVNAALGDGWLVRTRADEGSAHLLEPSAAGREALAADHAVLADKFARALDRVGPETARRLVADLATLNDAMDEQDALRR